MLQHPSAGFAGATADGQRQLARLQSLAAVSPHQSALRVKQRDLWQVLTWSDLQRLVAALGHHLTGLGFVPGSQLRLAGELSLGAITLALASWSSGGSVTVIGQLPLPSALHCIDRGAAPTFAYASGDHRIAPAALLRDATDTLLVDHAAPPLGTHPDQSCRVLPDLLGQATSASSDHRQTRSLAAASYWLEETSNDLAKLPDLVDFWLAAGIALSLPGPAPSQPAPRSAALRKPWRRPFTGRREGLPGVEYLSAS